jgi:hypothetical protein
MTRAFRLRIQSLCSHGLQVSSIPLVIEQESHATTTLGILFRLLGVVCCCRASLYSLELETVSLELETVSLLASRGLLLVVVERKQYQVGVPYQFSSKIDK